MKKELDSKTVYIIVGIVLLVVIVLYLRSAGDQVVPASQIKSPPPPGGFPSGPRAGQNQAAPLPDQ